ncbi:50S ribosomal protein L11 methyltransferase [Thiovibrio sp. JS02]
MPANTPSTTPVKSWLRITITAEETCADIIAGFLSEQTGGVEQVPITAGACSTPREKIISYLKNDEHAADELTKMEEFLTRLAAFLPDNLQPSLETEVIEEVDWNKAWKERFKPFPITAHLVIKPTWEPYAAGNTEKVIEMDPGMAFGTGHHASTRLALSFIEKLFHGTDAPPQSVLDVGTGTGILAMASALFGAQKVVATDNDPEAVGVAIENIERNNLKEAIETSGTDLENIPGTFALVIANIIHDTLLEIASPLCLHLAAGGHLILAGILTGPQTENIRTTYTTMGLAHVETKSEGEWSALLFRKP